MTFIRATSASSSSVRLVASASPLTGQLASLHELADAGAGAVVLPSLFEEELVVAGDEHAATCSGDDADVPGGATAYLDRIDLRTWSRTSTSCATQPASSTSL